MKVKITLELDAAEAAKASELVALVQSFADSTVQVRSADTPATVAAAGGGTAAEQRLRFREQCAGLLVVIGQAGADEGEPGARAAVQDAQNKVCTLLETAKYRADLVLDDFYAVFADAAFSEVRVQQGLSIVPYMALLLRLPEAARVEMRSRVLQTVVEHLNQKRPVDANRMDFFAYAEAFAALVKLEFVNIDAAVGTITTLLQPLETRCAGITMLGKTVELCLPLITGKCDPAKLADLRRALAYVTEDVFQYDVNYITDNMSWSRGILPLTSAVQQQQQLQEHNNNSSSSSSSSSSSDGVPLSQKKQQQSSSTTPREGRTRRPVGERPVGRFVCGGRFLGHKDMLYTLSYDHSHSTLVSGSRDGSLLSWDTAGQAFGSTVLPRLYACATDINPHTGSLYVCGVPLKDVPGPVATPALLLYTRATGTPAHTGDDDADGDGSVGDSAATSPRSPQQSCVSWQLRGVLGRDVSREGRVISCVQTLVPGAGGGSHFATGESLTGDVAGCVRVYDEAAAPFGRLTPLVSYREHKSFVTTLAAHPSSEGLLFSGSDDGTVRLWDIRQPRSAATVGMGTDTTSTSTSTSSTSSDDSDDDSKAAPMVTSIHTHGCVLAAGSVDSALRLWDLRKLDVPLFQSTVDGTAVLKVTLSPLSTSSYPVVAVSTSSDGGLYTAFPAIGKICAAKPAPPELSLPAPPAPCSFYDLAWGERDESGSPVLYAAGTELRAYISCWDP